MVVLSTLILLLKDVEANSLTTTQFQLSNFEHELEFIKTISQGKSISFPSEYKVNFLLIKHVLSSSLLIAPLFFDQNLKYFGIRITSSKIFQSSS